jgi:Dynein light intermediate chain (DLIC)
MLEKDHDFKAEIFDYIQLYLRKVSPFSSTLFPLVSYLLNLIYAIKTCLKYGALLVYTSAKKDINTELLVDCIHTLLELERRGLRWRVGKLEE